MFQSHPSTHTDIVSHIVSDKHSSNATMILVWGFILLTRTAGQSTTTASYKKVCCQLLNVPGPKNLTIMVDRL